MNVKGEFETHLSMAPEISINRQIVKLILIGARKLLIFSSN